jgi:hypothetical protein
MFIAWRVAILLGVSFVAGIALSLILDAVGVSLPIQAVLAVFLGGALAVVGVGLMAGAA